MRNPISASGKHALHASTAIAFSICLFAAGRAVAQSDPAAAPGVGANATTPNAAVPATGNGGPGNDGGEIIVTAEKRSVAINKLGVTVAAFTGDTLAKQGISSVRDLAKIVPGLTYSESAASTPVYTLRGVGFYETSLAAYPDVSVYVDQVPLPFPVLTTQAGLDLERVEVIKGPQGILFGQNSTAGAINFIAAKPTHDFHAGGDFTFGRFNRAEATGFISGGLTDNLDARASFKIEHGGDWQYSYTTGEGSGKRRNYVGRILLDWHPSDRLRFELNLNGWINKSDPQAAQYFASNIQGSPATTPKAYALIQSVPLAPQNDRAADWAFHMRGNEQMGQSSLRADWDVASDVTLTSITAYAYYTKDNVDQNSGLFFADEDVHDHHGTIRSVTQELRLANGSANRFRWTVGGNFERSRVFERAVYWYSDAKGAGTLAEGFGVTGNDYYSNQKMKNYAGFGSAEFDLTSKLTIKGGVRYTQADRDYTGCTRNTADNGGGIGPLYAGISQALTGKPVTIALGQCAILDQVTFFPVTYRATLNEHNTSWRAGLDYHVTSTFLLYGNITKGYKAGSFPTLGASVTNTLAPVTQESVLDYEAGFKSQLFDRAVTLTGALFDYDYRNKQVRTKLISPIFGVIDALANVPKSRIRGGELSVTARPMPGLDLSGSATYIDTRVQRYVGVNGQGVTANFAGTHLPFSPPWSAAASADYHWPVGNGLLAGVGTTATYNGATSAVVGGGDVSRLKAYALLDVRASLGAENGRWTVSLWGRNITNTYYWSNVQTVYDTTVRYTGQPLTYGGTVGFRF